MKHTALLFLVPLLGACAYAKIVKIPHPASYGYRPGSKEWQDALRRADEIEGARFYLPRPYVIVKKEYPVAGETFFLDGTMEPDGSVTITTVPAQHAHAFPGGKFAGSIHDPNGLTQPAEPRLQSESGGAPAMPPTATEATVQTLGVANDSYVTVNSVAPQPIDSADRVVSLRVTIAKDPIAEGTGGTLQEGVWAVPVLQGKHEIGKAVKTALMQHTTTADGKHVFDAQLAAKQLPAFFSLGVIVKKTTDGTTTNFLFHRSTIDGTNAYADGAKPSVEPKKEPPNAAPKKPLSSATISSMGDPTTSPYQKVGDLFDIALYQDFTEQYAMRAAGGLGYAKADLAFENGWLVERVSMEMDNRELGLLIADTARKLVDVGIAAISPAAAAAEEIAAEPVVDQVRLQSEPGRKTLKLRVDFVEYAVPGMHPLLKPEEYGTNDRSPRVDYQRRSRYVVSLVDLRRADDGNPPPRSLLSAEDVKKITQAVLGDGWKSVDGYAEVFSKDPSFEVHNESLQVASPQGALPITYDSTAEQPGLTDGRREAYFRGLTAAIRQSTGVGALKGIEAKPRPK